MSCTLTAPCGGVKRLMLTDPESGRAIYECLNAHTLMEGPPPPRLASSPRPKSWTRDEWSEHGRKAARVRWTKTRTKRPRHTV